MSWEELAALILVIEVMIVMGMIAWAIPTIIDGIIKTSYKTKFGRELSRLFDNQKLDRNQIEILSKEYFLNSKDILLVARRQFKNVLSANEVKEDKLLYFQKLFKEYEQDEPFEGLPPDIRLHLERVREVLGKDNDHMLKPLASQLQELNEENIRKNKKMWRVSLASLIIGIASFSYSFVPNTYFSFSKNEINSVLEIQK